MILKEKKTLVLKENFNNLRKYFDFPNFFQRIPLQKFHKIFLRILLFQNIFCIFPFYFEKKLDFLGAVFFTCSLLTLLYKQLFYENNFMNI